MAHLFSSGLDHEVEDLHPVAQPHGLEPALVQRDLDEGVATPAADLSLVVFVGFAELHEMSAGKTVQLDSHRFPLASIAQDAARLSRCLAALFSRCRPF